MAEMQEAISPPGGLRSSDCGSRPITGPMKFVDDWPGVFIRGDEALGLACSLRAVVAWDGSKKAEMADAVMRRVATLLESCMVEKR